MGNCIEILHSIPDGSISMVFTDPPYYRVKAEALRQ